MIDVGSIPDPGDPPADGYYLLNAQAHLRAEGIDSPASFAAHFGVDVRGLTPFQILWLVAPSQGRRELYLNALYRAGRRTMRPRPISGGERKV